jgi:hypothetical protein
MGDDLRNGERKRKKKTKCVGMEGKAKAEKEKNRRDQILKANPTFCEILFRADSAFLFKHYNFLG